MGIQLELLALKGADASEEFDTDLFYKDILSVNTDYDLHSYDEPCQRFEDLLSR